MKQHYVRLRLFSFIFTELLESAQTKIATDVVFIFFVDIARDMGAISNN